MDGIQTNAEPPGADAISTGLLGREPTPQERALIKIAPVLIDSILHPEVKTQPVFAPGEDASPAAVHEAFKDLLREKAYNWYCTGISQRKIAFMMGISLETVNTYIAHERKRRKPQTDSDRAARDARRQDAIRFYEIVKSIAVSTLDLGSALKAQEAICKMDGLEPAQRHIHSGDAANPITVAAVSGESFTSNERVLIYQKIRRMDEVAKAMRSGEPIPPDPIDDISMMAKNVTASAEAAPQSEDSHSASTSDGSTERSA